MAYSHNYYHVLISEYLSGTCAKTSGDKILQLTYANFVLSKMQYERRYSLVSLSAGKAAALNILILGVSKYN